MNKQHTLKSFQETLKENKLYPLKASGIEVLQINFGKLCNQTCKHCHVDAGPDRTEMISRDILNRCLDLLRESEIGTVDITGGAPEMNPHFRWFVQKCSTLDRKVMVRSNLTILTEPDYKDMYRFFADQKVEIIASLSFYTEKDVDRQRGKGVFKKSIDALRELNKVGYGQTQNGLVLNLVYNPMGAFLPPIQSAIEKDFKKELDQRYSIVFNHLFALINLPVGRFKDFLERSGNYDCYMDRLITSFNPVAARAVMCRSTLSVGWNGYLYDCDFNQMLDLRVDHGTPDHIDNVDLNKLKKRTISLDLHCYGCTAGVGSSCGGSVIKDN